MRKQKTDNLIYNKLIDELVISRCFFLLEDKQGYSLFLRNFNYVKEVQRNTMFTLRTDNTHMMIAEAFAIVKNPKALKSLKNTFRDTYIYSVLAPSNIEDRMIPLLASDILNKNIKCSYDE